ncbi:hypothetical protein HWQ46_25365 [Shewanella sp. D64]|nr:MULTISPECIES: hypothetical protein [unclassified Shewanella]MEC4728848.1 hypothetical protein [Shewanella sp. D64]MEC4740722.1 hypothetical protein [Shewanella sp. E94]
MLKPANELAVISDEAIAQNRIDLALPIITQNYKAYFTLREKLIGLQNLITEFNQDKNHER